MLKTLNKIFCLNHDWDKKLVSNHNPDRSQYTYKYSCKNCKCEKFDKRIFTIYRRKDERNK